MAADLREFLTETVPYVVTGSIQADGNEQPSRVIPKGLRSFDEHDADFFLRLLPGPLDRNGVPESVRRWLTAIESTEPHDSFRVGLVYGPSGSGKSSLFRAGVLPRLARHVCPVFVDAATDDTESRLMCRLRCKFSSLPETISLVDAMATLRRCDLRGTCRKVLLVIDQFEQWLHGHRDMADTELVRALRQCDGHSVQCVVLTGMIFWMGITHFMQSLEAPHPGRTNSGTRVGSSSI